MYNKRLEELKNIDPAFGLLGKEVFVGIATCTLEKLSFSTENPSFLVPAVPAPTIKNEEVLF